MSNTVWLMNLLCVKHSNCAKHSYGALVECQAKQNGVNISGKK